MAKDNERKTTLNLLDRIADAVEDIAEGGGGGGGGGGSGSELPAVTAADNGDVLTVVEGAWAKAAPASGGILVVRLTGDPGTLTATWQDIFDADYAVCLLHNSETERSFLLLNSVLIAGEDQYAVVFSDISGSEELYLETTSADGYPSETQNNDG